MVLALSTNVVARTSLLVTATVMGTRPMPSAFAEALARQTPTTMAFAMHLKSYWNMKAAPTALLATTSLVPRSRTAVANTMTPSAFVVAYAPPIPMAMASAMTQKPADAPTATPATSTLQPQTMTGPV